MNFDLLEIIGYIASIVVVLSLLMKSILRLRIINLVGAFVFVIYGILIGAYPVVATNGIIVLIDIYYLIQMYKNKDDEFETMPSFCGDDYFNSFMKLYKNDIKHFNPSFEMPAGDGVKIAFILRNLIPAGVVISHPENDGYWVDLDFAIPLYRDLKVGDYVFSNKEIFTDTNQEITVYAKGEQKKHIAYLKKTGFELLEDGIYALKMK